MTLRVQRRHEQRVDSSEGGVVGGMAELLLGSRRFRGEPLGGEMGRDCMEPVLEVLTFTRFNFFREEWTWGEVNTRESHF